MSKFSDNFTIFHYKQEIKFQNEHTFIHDLFYFQKLTTYTCGCRYESFTYENFLEIPIITLEEKDEIELKALIKNYFESSEICFGS